MKTVVTIFAPIILLFVLAWISILGWRYINRVRIKRRQNITRIK